MSTAPQDTVPRDQTGTRDAIRRLVAIEDKLVDRAIGLAKNNGYAPYTTTIRAAWSEAIRSLTDCLSQYLNTPPSVTAGPRADVTYRTDPRFTRMRQVARRHRSLGITLELYNGLFKHFRRVYTEELSLQHGPEMLCRVQDFFDETELSVTADWTASGDDRRLSELQQRTRALTLQKDRYVAVFESLRNPAFLLDRAQGLVHANHAAIELFIGGGEVGDSLYLADRKAMTDALTSRVSELIAHEEDCALWLDTTSGRGCFDVRLRPLQDAVDNTSLGYLLQLYDVTAHRLATEQAQRAERQMSRFLATMSHEIRTPLHSVLGAAGLLRRSDQEDRHVYLDVIQGAGQTLLLTLNNVLDYSKLEAGPPVPHPTSTALRAALASFRETTVIGSSAAPPDLRIDVAEDVPNWLLIDWTMTRQVLTNLVSNALRHDEGGGVEISVMRRTAGSVAAPLSGLSIHIRDHGPGFREEDIARFGDPFEDTRPRYTAEGGAGLGLAISRYLVSSMDGEIGVGNTPIGAHVWFTVSCEEASDGPRQGHTPVAEKTAQLTRCLVVDDDQIGAVVTCQQLRSLGLHVDHAASLTEARKALANESYEAIVADYLLPDGTGPELLSAPPAAHQTIRKIALTANLEALRARHDLGDIFDAVLEKPVDVASLAHVLFGSQSVQEAPSHKSEALSSSERPCLSGLSAQTVSAMIEAFADQWSAFRRQLKDLGTSETVEQLSDTAHRLAGSSAQLGLIDLVAPLRQLETGGDLDEDQLQKLISAIDNDLQNLPSWRALIEARGTA